MTISFNYSPAPLHQPVNDVEWFAWFVNLVRTINVSLGSLGGSISDDQRASNFWFNGSVWVDESANRAVNGTSYQNTLDKPIFISVVGKSANANNNFELYVSDNGSTWVKVSRWRFPYLSVYVLYTACAIVPSNHYYKVSGTNLHADFFWHELK